VRLSSRVEPPELRVDGDAERLHQVLANLVENAIRFSPEDGSVEVEAWREHDRTVIEVRDEGPGISDEDAARVFERFWRADHARTSSDGGAGLGLAIVRWIVELHGGEVSARRREPTGCRMVVILPEVHT
jgi:signal transduction histidine kinase